MTSLCDNAKTFHSLVQSSTLADYIDPFEQAMNLMRRDNPAIPRDYYVSSFVSRLSPYILSHLECLKPRDMQIAIWMLEAVIQ